MTGDSLRTQLNGEGVFERSAAEAAGGARSRGRESARAGRAVRGEQSVWVEALGAAEANGTGGAGGTAAWTGEQRHAGRRTTVAKLGATATRLDVGGDPGAALGNGAAAGQPGTAVAGAGGAAGWGPKKTLHPPKKG